MPAVIVGRDWCMSRFSLIKWLEIALSIAIIVLIVPGTQYWVGYAYMIAVGSVCLVVALFTMLYYFLGYHSTIEQVPYVGCEAFFNIICVLLNLACFGLAVYDTVMMYQGSWTVHTFPYQTPEWRDRLTAIAVISALNAIAFFFSCTYSDQQHFKVAYWTVAA